MIGNACPKETRRRVGAGQTIPGDMDVASGGGSTAAAGPTDMDVASSGCTSNMDVPLIV